MAGSVGTVYYDVLPNLDGFAAKVSSGLGSQKPIKIPVEVDNQKAAASLKDVTTKTNGLTQSSARLAAAQGRVRVTAAQLNEVRAKSTTGSARLVQAEERHATALRNVGKAQQADARDALRAAAIKQKASDQAAAAAAKEAAAAQKAAALQKQARGQTVQKIGTGLLVAGAATAAALGGIVKVTADFDQAVSNVASTGKEASVSIGQLRAEAIKYGADTAFSATEAANAQAELIKANVSVTDTINGGLKGALDLAAAGSLGVADAAGIMGTAMSQFKIPGTDASHVADLLSAAAGKAQGEVGDFAEALKYVGPLANSAGVSIEETTGVLAEFANQGILGSQAGTSLRGIFLGLTAPVGAGAKAIEKYGINVRDASGNFIGLEGAAGELQKRLGGLSRAQRDAALAAIFGRNQVTAATILYNEGAKGVQTWTNAVNESGYAARTAATKMDNLKGDVEQLKGALDSAFIQSGGGGTEFLRGLAQGATGLVDSFNALSPAAQEGAFKLAALGGAAALAAGGVIKILGVAASAQASIAALGLSAAATRTKLALLSGPLLLAAAGFIAAQAASAGMQDQLDKNSAGIDGYTRSLEGLKRGDLDKQFGKFGDSFALLGQGVDNTASAFKLLKDTQNPVSQGFRKIGDALGMVSTAGATAAEFDKLDQALVRMSPEKAAAGFSLLFDQGRRAGLSVEQINATFDDYKAKQEQAASATGAAASSLRASEIAFKNAGDAATGTAGGIDSTGAAAGRTAEELAALTAEIYAAASAQLSLSGNAIAVEAAMDAATASAKKNGDTHDINTAKGRENATALNNLANAALTTTSAMNEQGKSASSIAAQNERAKSSFIKSAQSMGYSGKAARALADDLFVLPDTVTSQVVVSGAKVSAGEAKSLNKALQSIPKSKRANIVTIANTKGAKAAQVEIAKVKNKSVIAKATGKGVNTVKEIDAAIKKLKSKAVRATAAAAGKPAVKALHDAITALKNKRVTASANATGGGAVRNLQGDINSLHGKTVYVNVVRRAHNSGSGGGSPVNADGGTLRLPRHAIGGTIQGTGGPRQDNIAMYDRVTGLQTAWGSVGEEVINQQQAELNRKQLKQINAGGKWDLIPRRASGGTLGSASTSTGSRSGSRPLILNISMGELGIRRFVTEIMDDRDEYSLSVGRMGGN